ncbi:MAG: beta-ketoacyl-ACP synthase II [Lentisphaeria bacterium]|nr:beta-ketoacyl-ACP synthase II [Lentisphaeria bacterium]
MKGPAAITGMGLICPVGNTLDEAWKAIRNGQSGIGPITCFNPERVPSKVAAQVKGFDPEAYMNHKTARRMARFSQLSVAAARMAWQNAQLPDLRTLSELAERTAVTLGVGMGGNEVDSASHRRMVEMGPRRIQTLTVPKVIINQGAGNIAMELGVRGPVHSIVTACASGTDAIGYGLDAIRSGRADIVLAGGAESAITEYGVGAFCALRALSTSFNDCPTEASRPFDRRRDGFVMGEAAAVLILERPEHAIARGAPILALLAGYGATCDCYHLTAPEPEGRGAARAIRQALKDAGLLPEDIDYVNAHGTSTPANDPVETKAIRSAFGAHAENLLVSSTKSMTGHCLGAAGGIEAILSVMAIRDQFAPPTINLTDPDDGCDLDYVPLTGRSAPIRAAVSTSLGFGGHNGVLVLRSADA